MLKTDLSRCMENKQYEEALCVEITDSYEIERYRAAFSKNTSCGKASFAPVQYCENLCLKSYAKIEKINLCHKRLLI